MASFRYSAITSSGAVTTGVLDADSEDDAIAQVRGLGHLPLKASPASAARWRNLFSNAVPRARTVSAGTIAVATQELAALLEARLPLDRALAILSELEDTKRLREPLAKVLTAVQDGMSLADAFESTGVFPKSYVTMVRAGEHGGNLEVTLKRLADYLARAAAVRDTVISAMVYPALLLCTAGLSVVFILVFVLPEFAPLFAQAGKALPPSTRIIMNIGDFLTSYWWLLLILACAAFLLLRRAAKLPGLRRAWDRIILRLPILGDLALKIDVERFARMLGTLLMNGVTLPRALLITRDTLSNSVVAEAVGDAAARLKEGEQLAGRLRRSGLFPPLALDLIRVGEETGSLDAMLLKQAEFYEREVKHTIDRLLALLVPLMTVLMGVIVAGIIASIIVAIFSLNDLAV
ncbi:MAG TPA: type II secretion system F family protein [Rhizomicrobium sp.]|jgi:general secretion pathway protein F